MSKERDRTNYYNRRNEARKQDANTRSTASQSDLNKFILPDGVTFRFEPNDPLNRGVTRWASATISRKSNLRSKGGV